MKVSRSSESSPWLREGLLCLLSLVPLLVPGLARADDRDPTVRLQEIRAGVDSAEGEISKMKSEFNALLQKRQQIEATLAKLREEDRGLERRIEELQQKERKLSGNVDASERRVTEIQKKIQLRLRVTYMTSRIAAAPELSGLSAKGQLERLSYYMRKVRDFDARLFREASEAIATLRRDRSALREALESQTKVREELRAKKSSVEAEAEKLKVVTDELAQRQRAAQAALVRLQHEAKRVEAMIAEITSKEDDDEERDATPTPESGSTPPSQPDVAEDHRLPIERKAEA